MKGHKTLFVVYYHLGLGGVQRKIVDILNYYDTHLPELQIFVILRYNPVVPIRWGLHNKNVTIITYADKRIFPFFFPFFVTHLAWRLRPSALLAFSGIPAVSAVIAKLILFWRSLKVVISEDGPLDPTVESNNPLYPVFHRVLVTIFYRFANAILVVNQRYANDLRQKYLLSRTKIVTIHNWSRFATSPGVQKHKLIYDIAYVGRLDRIKNLTLLVRTVRVLKKKNQHISCCIVGSGDQEKSLKNLVHKYTLTDNVTFIPPVSDTESYMARSKSVIFLSKNEGLPMALLEAMSLEIPVVCPSIIGIDDEILKRCVVFQNENELVLKLLILLNNTKIRKRIGKRARLYIQQRYSLESIKNYSRALHLP